MNIQRTRLLALLALSPVFTSLGRADAAAYAKILTERDAVLAKIVARKESMFATGLTDGEAVVAARVALWSFRRDTASSKAEKVAQQQSIVAVYEKRLQEQKTRVQAGLAGDDEVLLATDAWLQAEQLLEELQLEEQTVTRPSPRSG